jgi:predicted RNase H-like HicB family nuclease
MISADSKRIYPVIVEQDEDGFFVATNTAFSGCYSQGKTIEEALANIREATALCLADSENTADQPISKTIGVHLITA